MKIIFILLSTAIFLYSCVDEFRIAEPYKTEKLAVIKSINTTGETELIRKVKLEQFELGEVVLTKDIIEALDSQINLKKQSMIESCEKNIKIYKDYRDGSYKDAKETNSSDLKNSYLQSAKNFENNLKNYEAELKSYENGTFNNPLIDYYENSKKKYLEYGDTIVRVFDVVYRIKNARTTTHYPFFGKIDSITYNKEFTKTFLISEMLKKEKK